MVNELTEDRIVQELSMAGYPITQPRQAVIRAVMLDGGYSSPWEICERAREHRPSVGYVTVYRTLDLLSRTGLVRRIYTENGCNGHPSAGLSHRHHLICRQGGTAVEFEGYELSPFLAQLGRQTGHCIEEHLLELVGLCPECR